MHEYLVAALMLPRPASMGCDLDNRGGNFYAVI